MKDRRTKRQKQKDNDKLKDHYSNEYVDPFNGGEYSDDDWDLWEDSP